MPLRRALPRPRGCGRGPAGDLARLAQDDADHARPAATLGRSHQHVSGVERVAGLHAADPGVLGDQVVPVRHLSRSRTGLELGLRQLDQQTKLLRLLDAALAFPELERAAHDAAVLTGKQVTFSARGNVKLDAHVLSPLRGALLHLVRNAVAHGIEPALT